MTPSHPRAVDGLERHEDTDGLIVYHPDTDRVHYLNNTAAIVFELCDGDHTVTEMAHELARLFGLDAPPATETAACVERLRAEEIVR
jgi:hypothetical protein